MKKRLYIAIILMAFTSLLVSACVSTEGQVSTDIPKGITPAVTDELSPQSNAAAEAAMQELADQLGVDAKDIKVISVSAAQWSDSCLGAPKSDEMCAEVITPGFSGILDVNGVQYEFHSDQSGDQIRFIPPAIQAAQQALANKLGVNREIVRMVSYEHMMWRDSCLGVQVGKEICLEVITPGYRIVLEVDGKQYVYHTDETGTNLILAEQPQAGIGDALIVWSESDELGCQQALINLGEVSFGLCEGTMTNVSFSNDFDSHDLVYFIEKYEAFEALTAGGKISFSGEGNEIATPAEQRMIAEWAKLIKQVAEAGRTGAAWGLALAWHREGGIAGFCDDLAIHMTGVALASSCKLGQEAVPERIFLNASQLEQLYAWVDSLSTFEIKQTDPAAADAMTIYLQVVSSGDEEASSAVQQAILDFAVEVYTQAYSIKSTE
jgi:hypothetical protein